MGESSYIHVNRESGKNVRTKELYYKPVKRLVLNQMQKIMFCHHTAGQYFENVAKFKCI
jgi:hypothetical protein